MPSSASLADFPAATLHEPIPNFHNTPDRYRKLHQALAEDPLGRAKDCQAEIRAYLDREAGADSIVKGLAGGARSPSGSPTTTPS